MNHSMICRVASGVAMLLVLAACGSNQNGTSSSSSTNAATAGQLQIFSQGQVNHIEQNGTHYISMSANMNVGSMQMEANSLPVIDPRSNQQVGQIDVQASQNGQSAMTLNLNVSQIAQVEGSTPITTLALPNGSALPLNGVNPANVLVLPAGSSGSNVFLNLAEGILGIAMVIPQFSAVASVINMFLPLVLGNSTSTLTSGLAGIFSGSNPFSSGLALFSDISQILNEIFGGGSSTTTPAPAPSTTTSSATASSGGSSVLSGLAGVASGISTVSSLFGGIGSVISSVAGFVSNILNGISGLLGGSSPSSAAAPATTTVSSIASTASSVSSSINTVATNLAQSPAVQTASSSPFVEVQPNENDLLLLETLISTLNMQNASVNVQ